MHFLKKRSNQKITMKAFITVVIAFAFFITSGFGQTKKDKDIIRRINHHLTQIDQAGFNGAVIVEFNGEKKFSRGFGESDKEKQIKNSPNTIFDIGSVTKQFTAAAILKLEMEGKLSTEDKISKYFQNVPADKAHITIHDLLRHQSGLISNVGKDFEKTGEEEFLNKVLTSGLKFEAGTRFSYSNIGYSLLGMIIEKVSAQSYETYLYENLWKPAQMEMTGYTRPEFDTHLIAIGYDEEDTAWGKPTDHEWDITSPYWHLKANGGILSTTEDLYKWHKALMTDHILSKEAIQKMYHPALRPEETEKSYYAYGWDISRTARNTTSVWHNGSNHIFLC
jgi:CubicO group peptidase (beta-lactamase class C family)